MEITHQPRPGARAMLDHALAYAALGIPAMPLFKSNSREGVRLRVVVGGIVRSVLSTPRQGVGGY